MEIAVLIVSMNRPDLVQKQLNQFKGYDVYLAESGDIKNCTNPDLYVKNFLGKAHLHSLLLDHVREQKRYEAYLIHMNDVFYDQKDFLHNLSLLLKDNGIVSAVNHDRKYPGSQGEGIWLLLPVIT